jgi:fucose 4-O-acetylase-like acetyltransferase
MALILIRRMASEGAVLGIPLIVTFSPVALVSVPIAALLTRFSGPWFLQGLPVDRLAIPLERFHLGLLLAIGAATVLATLIGNFVTIIFISRDRKKPALVPLATAVVLAVVVIALSGGRLVDVGGRPLWLHPAGLLSLAVIVCLVAATLWARGKGGEPVVEAT